MGKGAALLVLKRYDEALSAYERALDLAPKRISALGGKAEALYALQRYEDALAVCETAWKLDRSNLDVLLVKGRAHWRLNQKFDAMMAFAQLGIHTASEISRLLAAETAS